MTITTNSNVTQLLVDWRNGNQGALNQLMPLVYDELRGLAKRYLRRENAAHTSSNRRQGDDKDWSRNTPLRNGRKNRSCMAGENP